MGCDGRDEAHKSRPILVGLSGLHCHCDAQLRWRDWMRWSSRRARSGAKFDDVCMNRRILIGRRTLRVVQNTGGSTVFALQPLHAGGCTLPSLLKPTPFSQTHARCRPRSSAPTQLPPHGVAGLPHGGGGNTALLGCLGGARPCCSGNFCGGGRERVVF